MAEQTIEKVLRVFVSSVGKMMGVERDTLRNRIWKSGHVPIAMEAFTGNHFQNSIDVVLNNLRQADIIIFVFGYTYGSIIGNALKCADCPVRDVCNQKKRGRNAICSVSYTHFEYMYAKKEKILHYCIIQKNISDITTFKKRVAAYIDEHPFSTEGDRNEERNLIEESYYQNKSLQIELTTKDVNKGWSFFYDANNTTSLAAEIASIYATISSRFPMDASNVHGLVDGQTAEKELRKKNAEINQLKKTLSENESAFLNTLRQLSANQPNTAVTGTCIPFFYDSAKNEIVTYLVLNSAYKGNNRLMFPGGHAFSNDESPEAVAVAKALSEAGLIVKTVDLYKSFDMSSRSEKQITKEFTVYRPPHYTYLFKQSTEAKCYAKNHLFHYDAVYVSEILEVESSLKCSQERIQIRLPNKPLTVPKIRDEIKNQLHSCNEEKAKAKEPAIHAGDYLVQMLFEAHRDYVRYLAARGVQK